MELSNSPKKSFRLGNFSTLILILVVLSYANGDCDPGKCNTACHSQYGVVFFGEIAVPRETVGKCNDPTEGRNQGADYCGCYDKEGQRLND